MTPERRVTTFRLEEDLREGLDAVWRTEGIPPSEQVRRAIRAWLERKGIKTQQPASRLRSRRKAAL
jgi:hypothetical protein